MFALLLLTGFVTGAESKLTLKPGFKTVGDGLKSEHATQAAAATEKHVFAVSSTAVAMYDRVTGKLLATSDGKRNTSTARSCGRGRCTAHTRITRTRRRRARSACTTRKRTS